MTSSLMLIYYKIRRSIFFFKSKLIYIFVILLIDARLWWYQVCTEVAYFQVAPQNDSVRSELIDSRFR